VNESTKGVNHPYDIVIQNNLLYVANQVGYNVIEMSLDLQRSRVVASVINPRGLAFGSDGLLYVASESVGVVMVNVSSGTIVSIITADTPIGVVAYEDQVLFGTRGKDPAIYAWSIPHREIIYTMKHSKMDHPAGMAVWNDMLYVLSQSSKDLLAFDLQKAAYAGKVLDSVSVMRGGGGGEAEEEEETQGVDRVIAPETNNIENDR
jgi:hypothetical protein